MAISESRRLQPQVTSSLVEGEYYQYRNFRSPQNPNRGPTFVFAGGRGDGRRQAIGLEGIFREIFPIASYDGQFELGTYAEVAKTAIQRPMNVGSYG